MERGMKTRFCPLALGLESPALAAGGIEHRKGVSLLSVRRPGRVGRWLRSHCLQYLEMSQPHTQVTI